MLQPFSFLYLIDDFVFLCLQRFKQVGKVQQNAVELLHSTFVLVCAAFLLSQLYPCCAYRKSQRSSIILADGTSRTDILAAMVTCTVSVGLSRHSHTQAALPGLAFFFFAFQPRGSIKGQFKKKIKGKDYDSDLAQQTASQSTLSEQFKG